MSGERPPNEPDSDIGGNTDPSTDGDAATSLRAGFSLSELQLPELWIACAGLGGGFTEAELEAALRGTHTLTEHEHDVVAQALNDYFTERGQNHPVSYFDEVTERRRRTLRPHEH